MGRRLSCLVRFDPFLFASWNRNQILFHSKFRVVQRMCRTRALSLGLIKVVGRYGSTKLGAAIMTRNYGQWLLILLLTSAVADAQKIPPKYLAEASSCLVGGRHDWLDWNGLGKTDLTLGYWRDSKSRPHEKHLIVVAFTNPDKGRVFDFWMRRRHGRQMFIIEKDAEFVLTDMGVKFVRPPLGGPWSSVHLELAVKRIEKRQRFSFSLEQLLDRPSEIQCSSYLESN